MPTAAQCPARPRLLARSIWVCLFFVNDPGSFCEWHGKSYLTRRRRGGEGGGGGSLTGRPGNAVELILLLVGEREWYQKFAT